jgi:hypothetical protein
MLKQHVEAVAPAFESRHVQVAPAPANQSNQGMLKQHVEAVAPADQSNHGVLKWHVQAIAPAFEYRCLEAAAPAFESGHIKVATPVFKPSFIKQHRGSHGTPWSRKKLQKLDSNLLNMTVILPTSNLLDMTVPTRSIHATPFVFEEPKTSYFELPFAERQELLSLGPLASARLLHIEKVHVVYQPLWKKQVTIARHLDAPHYYQATFRSFMFYREDKFSPQPASL